MKEFLMLAAVMALAAVCGAELLQISLPQMEYADTEVVTNVSFSADMDRTGDFGFSLSFNGTPSNNVEMAFGIDSDTNGVLSASETEMAIVWDCGEWKVCKGFDEIVLKAQDPMTNDYHSLTWKSRINGFGVPSLIEISDGSSPLFAEVSDTKPSWAYSRNWNMIRLTGRGIDVLNDQFEVVVRPEGLAIILR